MKTRSILAAVSMSAATAVAAPVASAEPIVREATGANPAAIQAAVGQFRADLGGGTQAGPNGSFGGVRREINWDGVPDSFAGVRQFPGGFFNSNSPRGAVFATPGRGFLLSDDDDVPPDDDGDEARFSNFNDAFATVFATFSPQRLFTPIDSPITETLFRVPGADTPASTNGFGVVFTDVDAAGSARLELTGPGGEDLGAFSAPATPGDGSLSFVGVSFNAGERIARAKITSGTGEVIDTEEDQQVEADVTQGGPADLVVMDDFIYGEPVALAAGGGNGGEDDPAPVDGQAPNVKVKAKAKLRLAALRKGLTLQVTTDEDATLDVSLLATASRIQLGRLPRRLSRQRQGSRANVLLAELSRGFGSGTRGMKLKPRRRLLRNAGSFRVRLRVVAIDRAGNREVVKRAIRVR